MSTRPRFRDRMAERCARMPNLDQASCEIERDKTRASHPPAAPAETGLRAGPQKVKGTCVRPGGQRYECQRRREPPLEASGTESLAGAGRSCMRRNVLRR